jgi:hypothetical protein
LQLLSAVLVAAFTGGLWLTSIWQWAAIAKQSKIADKTLIETRRQIELPHRPWVQVTVKVVGDGLMFTSEGSAGITLRVSMLNSGSSPAMRVFPEIEIYPQGPSRLRPPAEQRRLCEPLRNLGRDSGWGFPTTLFPERTEIRDVKISMMADEIRTASSGSADSDSTTKTCVPFVVGCVDYMFHFAEGHHQTGFIFILSRTDNRPLETMVNVPADHLYLVPLIEVDAD